jgi:S-DNA-T family DNA segregation ATPase FtsK/SpoIIIE
MSALRTACKFPQHHGKEGGGVPVLGVLALAAVITAAVLIVLYWVWIVTAAAFIIGLVAVESAVRFALLDRAAKRYWLPARWHRFQWRRTAKNLRLAPVDRHRGDQIDSGRAKTVNLPRARFYPDPFGFRVRLKLVPGVNRADVEATADYLSVAWRAQRIAVTQPKPHRLELRALRRDPLWEPYPQSAIPDGILPPDPAADLRRLSLYLGRDEWGEHRRIGLSGVAGITIGGQPGYGKTEFVNFLLRQLAPLPARFILIDGKGSADFEPWRDRADILAGDDLSECAAAVDTAHTEMRMRLGNIRDLTGGSANGWHAGPSDDFPLRVMVVDEASTFFDPDGFKGDREAEKTARQIRFLSGQLAKKGRSALCLSIFITQKMTGDAIPTGVRDQCAVGMSFAVRTREGATAALGDSIKEFPSYCPTTLQSPDYVGVMTARLPVLGADPFVRLRVPKLDPLPVPVPVPDPAAAPVLQEVTS